MEKEVFQVLKYFQIFDYLPSFEEIYTFLPKKTSRIALKKALLILERKKKIKKIDIRYLILDIKKKDTPLEYSIKSKIYPISNNQYPISYDLYKKRYKISKKKLENWRFKLYLKLLSFFPQIKLIGLSGSLAMMNVDKDDDIDLFIITAKNRLFTGRFIAVFLAEVLGIRRRRDNIRSTFHVLRYTDKVCLNLFFDESDLSVPKFKKTKYVAHEILQMKPIINKNYTYEKFLYANKWVLSFFPNAAEISNFKFLISSQFQISKFKNYKLNKNFKLRIKNLSDWLEDKLKRFQLKLIKKHQTTELITDTQLWFHPDDFEKKIKI